MAATLYETVLETWLREVEQRCAWAVGDIKQYPALPVTTCYLVLEDVPWLISEVRRLASLPSPAVPPAIANE